MSLTISVEPQLEARIREEARRRGETAEELLSREVAIRWASAPNIPRLTADEAALLQTINAGLPESFWSRYRELTDRRRSESLTEPEWQELISLSDQAEEKTLQRTEALVALAQLRHVGLDALRDSLGIRPVSVVS